MERSHSINQRCRCFGAPADAGSFQNVILKGHAFGIVFRKPGFCGVLVGEDLARMPRSPTGTNTGTFATHTHRIAPNQDNSELQGDVKTKMGGLSRGDNRVVTGLADRERAVCHVAYLGHDRGRNSRSIDPQNAKRCRPLNGNGPGPSLRFLVG
jgi:hypothetical protein